MVNRTLQYANGSFFSVIPAALIDCIGLRAGDKISFSIETGKIIVAPAHPSKNDAGCSHSPSVNEGCSNDDKGISG